MSAPCPKCKAPVHESDLEVIGVMEATGGYPEAFDMKLTCPECGATFNTFVGIDQFTALDE